MREDLGLHTSSCVTAVGDGAKFTMCVDELARREVLLDSRPIQLSVDRRDVSSSTSDSNAPPGSPRKGVARSSGADVGPHILEAGVDGHILAIRTRVLTTVPSSSEASHTILSVPAVDPLVSYHPMSSVPCDGGPRDTITFRSSLHEAHERSVRVLKLRRRRDIASKRS